MKKITPLFLFFLVIIGCQKKSDTIDFESEVKWKSFKIVNSETEQDIEFTDTKSISYGLISIEQDYRIEKISDSLARIFFGDNSALLKASSSNEYDYIILGETYNDTLLLKQNKNQLDKGSYNGTWIESPNLSYTIKDGSIVMYLNDSIQKTSDVSFDLTNKYLKFDLKHSDNKIEYIWKVENIQNDSILISKGYKTDEGWSTVYDKVLIKKR